MAELLQRIEAGDPLAIGAVAGGVVLLVLFALLIWAVRASRRSAAAAEPLAANLGQLADAIRGLDAGQHQLAGGLKMVSEHQASAQARIMESVERRLEEVQRAMGESLHGTATRTARSPARRT